MNPTTLSLCDTDAIVAAVAKRAPESGYPMNLPLASHDAKVVQAAVNQGIDARLEACFVPARGDRFEIVQPGLDIVSRVGGARLMCHVSAQSLPVLVRRLLEMDPDGVGEDGSMADHAMSLASSICDTLNVEVV